MNHKTLAAAGLSMALLFVTGCDAGTPVQGEGEARVQILLTDAPADYIEEAWVWISRVYLIPGEEDPEQGPPFVDLFNDAENPLSYDLLTLRDGVIADMTGEVDVPAGRYNQLRMIVADAEVTLVDGYTFSDGGSTRKLFIPSGARSGIKVNLSEAITTEAGTISVVLVDFDVDQNFVIQGNPASPAGIQGVLFTPKLRELSRTVDRN
ncbi:MAG: DUF4382 domain-containing protein [Gemmatimonadales bacterium]|nr:MAG: DUF4382 domain-containing protein [Gemmatimonadales bacterium]